jgi:hypothetical protein
MYLSLNNWMNARVLLVDEPKMILWDRRFTGSSCRKGGHINHEWSRYLRVSEMFCSHWACRTVSAVAVLPPLPHEFRLLRQTRATRTLQVRRFNTGTYRNMQNTTAFPMERIRFPKDVVVATTSYQKGCRSTSARSANTLLVERRATRFNTGTGTWKIFIILCATAFPLDC